MEFTIGNRELEAFNARLNDPEQLEAYKKPFDGYHPQLLPRILGGFLVLCGNLVYGYEPSYLKFRAVEVIARVPYHSWSSAAYTLLTLFYSDEQKAMRLSKVTRFARIAQDNETMHVVVISHLAQEEKAGFARYTLIPMLFAFFYFWASYVLYLLRPRWSYELNYLFESHAYEQYGRFLATRGEELKKKPIISDFLVWYGRNHKDQYEFFNSVRNDEIIHRNQSIHEIDEDADKRHVRFLKWLLVFAAVILSASLVFLITHYYNLIV